ncbi:efflux RND transporter periplasmic adaptor subunit [Rhodopseudomonas pseudopalustris]|uniref:Membrane fusion protein, multidrug efflux system n=1 Tax=Rhodopseudomonas pseudopalustris TaxID=1513892 RepID=A0A1H8R8G8_9BRAD|nr:efflux RND transporter periplasmic adaptor subunit [Rhodopseudomonas pseudopalustris]MBB1092258.1 efflux RND transporter periplasmic adaptor subunit [Rhodopseudomonas palustris]SEO62587.1 membrane fusion protein, multidrug efflux system [Rhodopseudomonas pseudopalustris]
MRGSTSFAFTAVALACLGLVLGGCSDSKVANAATTEKPEVSIITVKAYARSIVRELPGRIAPIRVADVRPRVSGIVVQRPFQQGSEVAVGDPLYKIDPRPFEVELKAAEAALAKAHAAREQATLQAKRVAMLANEQAASKAQNEVAASNSRQAEAEVAAREADVARARLNLEYATIRAPISGRIGAALVSEGALVVQNEQNSLATIQQLDRVYADFTQPVAEMVRLRRAFESGELDQIAPDAARARLVLDEGTLYPLPGKLLFSEAKVDAYTGQVTLRAEFENPNRELLPGMYVRVRIEQGYDPDAISVPEQAIQRNGGGGSEVFVVKDDNRVAVQPVRVGSQQDGQWLVLDGLKPGAQVVVEGFQKFAAGDAVTPVNADEPKAATVHHTAGSPKKVQ